MNITTHPIHPGHHHPIVELSSGKPGPGHPAHPAHPDGDDHRHHDLEIPWKSRGNPMEMVETYGNPMEMMVETGTVPLKRY